MTRRFADSPLRASIVDHDDAEENSKPTAEIDPFVLDVVRQRDWKRSQTC